MSEREQKIKAGIRKGINLVKAGKLNDQDDPYMVVAGFAIEQVPDVSFGEITSAIQEMRAAHEWTANMLGWPGLGRQVLDRLLPCLHTREAGIINCRKVLQFLSGD